MTNGTGGKSTNKKNKLKFYSLLIDCIDTFDLVILCRQYIKVFNPYISFQYLPVTVQQLRNLQSMLL